MSDKLTSGHAAYAILRSMKRARKSGFTVVEVMVVLAVTGLLFLSASALISGRSDQTEFDQSIRAIQQQIRNTINGVATGGYTTLNDFQCNSSSGLHITTAGPQTQGTNYGCVFLGQVMQFAVGSSSPEQFNTYTIAGLQNPPSQTLAASTPTVISPASTAQPGAPSDDFSSNNLEYGLHVYKMWYGNNRTHTVGAVGFFYHVDQTSSNGLQQLDLLPVIGTSLHQLVNTAVNQVNPPHNWGANPVNPVGGVSICFASGSTNQSGLITIGNGNSSSQLSVSLTVMGGTVC